MGGSVEQHPQQQVADGAQSQSAPALQPSGVMSAAGGSQAAGLPGGSGSSEPTPHTASAAAPAGSQQQPQPQPPPQQQQWAAINFARDVVLQGKLGSGAFGTVYAALWLRPPASALHSFGPVLEVALPAQAPGRGRSLAQGGVKTVAGVQVAVKVVPLMGDGGMTYSARSLDLLKQEIQVRVMCVRVMCDV
jgi:hypothetical protein